MLATAGSAAAETMMIGTPLVIARVGGLKEFFMFGDVGLAVEPGDTGGLAEAIDRLAADVELARELGCRAHRVAVKYFNLTRHIKRLIEIFSLFCRRHYLRSLP